MNAQIVLVDGIPGSGKSVVAQTIKRRMREADHHVRWWYEEELDHAIYIFRDAATLHRVTDDLFSGAHQGVIAEALQKWGSFAEEARHTGTSVVADGAFFGYLTWTLRYLDRPEAETRAYVRGVQEALASLRPCLIYLRQRDVAATMRNLLAVRGPAWAERTIRKAVESPYGRAHGLNRVDGFEGLTRFWSDYLALEERLFDEARLEKLAVDVVVGSWALVEASIAAWLDLPPVQAIDPGDLERFVGAYRAADGSVAHVEPAERGDQAGDQAGSRESAASWSEVLRSLNERGLTEAPLLAIGDGALGLWAALDEVFPTTRHQRCWNHRVLNVIDKLPKRLQPELRKKLRALAEAPTRQECERRRDGLCAWLRGQGQEPAAACLERDWEDFITFYSFPEEHWVHLRTSNPIESIFSGVRLRTNASKRLRVRENALYLVFKLVLRLSLNWRAINAPNQLRLLLAGHQFRDGQLVLEDARAPTLAQAVGA